MTEYQTRVFKWADTLLASNGIEPRFEAQAARIEAHAENRALAPFSKSRCQRTLELGDFPDFEALEKTKRASLAALTVEAEKKIAALRED